jgi:hypothetical protein
VLWALVTLQFRLLLAAETGSTKAILSENLLIRAIKPANRA